MPEIKIKITLVTIKITLVAQLGECRGGIYIGFLSNQFFHVWLGCGRGSNTRVELIARWDLLFFANFKRITLLLEEGTLYFEEFMDSTLVDKGSIHCN